MNFFDWSLPLGRWFGIRVQIHLTFFLFVVPKLFSAGSRLGVIVTALYIFVLFFSILLHEFGHSLAARFCDGESDEIILWPLGGLALCRTPFHPTAKLITTVAGPFVTFMLWAIFSVVMKFLPGVMGGVVGGLPYEICILVVDLIVEINLFLLLFNLIPAFPMDGGRILMELLWYKLGPDKAGHIAVTVSRALAIAGMAIGFTGASVPLWGFNLGGTMLGILSLFIFLSAESERAALESCSIPRSFSLKERLKRRGRQKKFFDEIHQDPVESSFHQCCVCKKTEHDGRDITFRVSADGKEYCLQHLPASAKAPRS